MLKILCFILLLFIASIGSMAQSIKYSCANGVVKFKSEAPLEIIEAQSNNLQGLIETESKTFAFTILIRTFEGFNSPLQREHFNENYLESEIFPAATFKGKIIEEVDFDNDGIYTVRAKGLFEIHGVKQERIIKVTISIKNGTIKSSAKFTISLADFNISIPKIVNQKLASVVSVSIDASLTKR